MLFSFLNTEEELNSVLAGYFQKLMFVLINSTSSKGCLNHQSELYHYVYRSPELFVAMTRHLYSKSISDVLVKLLNPPVGLLNEDTAVEATKVRADTVKAIIDRLTNECSEFDHINASAVLCDLIETRLVYETLLESQVLSHLCNVIDKEENIDSAKKAALSVLTRLCKEYKNNEAI